MTLKEASTTEMQKLLNEIISLLDIKVAPNETNTHVKRMYEFCLYLQNAYPAVRLSDVRMAYHLGCKCDLGIEMFAELNPRSFGKVMKAYQQFRKAIIITRPVQLLESKEEIPSEDEMDKDGRQLFRQAYQTFQQGREYRDYGNLLYNSLQAIGKIPFSEERIKAILHQAYQQIQSENSSIAKAGNTDRHKEARRIAGIMEEPKVFDEQPQDIRLLVTSRAKQIAFATLMRELIEMGVEADEFLDQEPI